MSRSRLHKNTLETNGNGYYNDSFPRQYDDHQKTIYSERNLAFFGGVVACFIILMKLYYHHYEGFKQLILERKLVKYEDIVTDGEVMLTYSWKTAVRYSRFWLPILCGFLTSYFTWIMVYLDSSIPGVQPPSPFSPNKYQRQSARSFHLNYVFAMFIGVLVSSYMYYKGVSIEY